MEKRIITTDVTEEDFSLGGISGRRRWMIILVRRRPRVL